MPHPGLNRPVFCFPANRKVEAILLLATTNIAFAQIFFPSKDQKLVVVGVITCQTATGEYKHHLLQKFIDPKSIQITYQVYISQILQPTFFYFV
jgi:hypothetical protein